MPPANSEGNLLVDFIDERIIKLQVDTCGLNRLVAHQHLQGSYVHALSNAKHGETVPERMRVNIWALNLLAIPFNDVVNLNPAYRVDWCVVVDSRFFGVR